MLYDTYNREEWSLSAHLFRLLHENLAETPSNSRLAQFLSAVRHAKPDSLPIPKNCAGRMSLSIAKSRSSETVFRSDVWRKALHSHMDALVKLIGTQEKVAPIYLYSTLPPESGLNDPTRTHPKQIALKGSSLFANTTDEKIYGEL